MSTRLSLHTLIALAASMLCFGCSSALHYLVPGTEKAVGADAEVVAVINQEQSMTKFDIHAINLPPPPRINEGSDTFVVWERRDNSQAFTRVGILKYDPGSRVGEMHEASVPETGFQLVITSESGPTPGAPSNNVVFEQIIDKS